MQWGSPGPSSSSSGAVLHQVSQWQPTLLKTSWHTAQCSAAARAPNCPWLCDGGAREHCARTSQRSSAHLPGFRSLTAKGITEIESGVEDFKPLGFF